MFKMKILFLAIFAVFQLLNTVNGEEDFVKGTPIFKKQSRGTTYCKTANLFECNESCDSLLVCQGMYTSPLLTQKCQGSTPYCESLATTAVCQTSPSSNCKAPPAIPFQCTGLGFFPDVTDCGKYYMCGGVNDLQTVFACPTGYYYSSIDTACKRGTTCSNIECPKTGALMNAYNLDPRFFYICNSGVARVYKCPEPNNIWLASSGCTFVCPAEGNYIKTNSEYYQCYFDGSTLKYTIQRCPFGLNDSPIRCRLVPSFSFSTIVPSTTSWNATS